MPYPGFIAQDFAGPDFGSSQMGQFGFDIAGVSYVFVANPAAGVGCKLVAYKSTDVGQTWSAVGSGPTIPILPGSGTPVWTVARDGSTAIALWAEMQENAPGSPWTVAHVGKAVFSFTSGSWSGQTQLANPGLDMYSHVAFADAFDRGVSLTLLQLIVRGPGNYILFYSGSCNVLTGTPTLERQGRVSYSTFNGTSFGSEVQLPGQSASYFYGPCGGCADTNGLITFLYTKKGWETLGAGRNTVVSCSLSAGNTLGTPVEVTPIYTDDFKGRMTVPTPVAYTTGGVAHVAFAAWTWVSGFTTEVRSFDSLSLATPVWVNTLVTNDQSVQPTLPHHFYGYPYILSLMSDGATIALVWTKTDVITDSAVAFYYSTTPATGTLAWTTPTLLWNPPVLDGAPAEATQVNLYPTTGGFGVLGVSTSTKTDVSVRVESSFIASSGAPPSAPTVTCGDPPGGLVGTPYSHAMPSTHTGAFSVHVTAGALPDGLTMDATGLITGTPTLAGSYTYTATITDTVGTGTVDCTITIAASSLGLGCASPPDGVVGEPYFHAFPVSGGAPPYTFAIISGILPPGLTLDSLNGEVSGTPTLAGDFEFTIQVSDDFDSTVGTCDIVISVAEVGGPDIACGSPPGGQVGVAYDHTFPVTDLPPGATGTYSITGGALPPGLTLNTATGEVTGTPTVPGHYSFTISLSFIAPELDVLTDASGGIVYTGTDTILVT